MKIFLLASSFPDEKNKASGIFNYRMVKQMMEMDEEVDVVFFRILLPGRKLISKYNYDEIKVTQVCLPLLPFDNYYSLRFNNLICRFLGWHLLKGQLRKCEIIHSVYLTNNSIYAGYWARKLNIPHIAQAIGSDVNSDMKRMVRLNRFKKWMNNIDGIIANSIALKKTIKRLFPDSPEIRTIYRGIQIGNVPICNSNRTNKDGVVFLFLGGLNPYKRLKYGINTKGGITLMNAWAIAETKLFSLKAKLIFGGPHSDCNVLRKWIAGLNYPQQIDVVGEVPPSNVKGLFCKSDLTVIPSMEEGLPNLLLESFANGKPVIGSTAGGIKEVVLNNETGYIFDYGNVNELAELLIKTASQKEENKIIGLKAFERAKNYFNADTYSSNVLNFYKQFIK